MVSAARAGSGGAGAGADGGGGEAGSGSSHPLEQAAKKDAANKTSKASRRVCDIDLSNAAEDRSLASAAGEVKPFACNIKLRCETAARAASAAGQKLWRGGAVEAPRPQGATREYSRPI